MLATLLTLLSASCFLQPVASIAATPLRRYGAITLRHIIDAAAAEAAAAAAITPILL